MPTRKIRDIDPCDKRFNPCRHPGHEPPSMMVYSPGEYEHECPGCGNVIRFTVHPTHFMGCEPERREPDQHPGWRTNNLLKKRMSC